MSKRIQTVVPDHIAGEIEKIVIEDHFADQSEFVRHCIREYLNQRMLKINKLEDKIESIINRKIDKKTFEVIPDSKKTNGNRVELIRDIIKRFGNKTRLFEVVQEAEKEGIAENDVIYLLKRMKREGNIYEVPEGYYHTI